MDAAKLLADAQQAVRDVTGIDDPSLRWSPERAQDEERWARMRRVSAAMQEYQRLCIIELGKILARHNPNAPSPFEPGEGEG